MAYFNEVSQREEHQAATAPETEIGEGQHRWGSGKVRITHVELCDGTGTPRRYILSAEEPSRCGCITAPRDGSKNPVFGLAIHHQNGAHITGPNTDFGGLQHPLHRG